MSVAATADNAVNATTPTAAQEESEYWDRVGENTDLAPGTGTVLAGEDDTPAATAAAATTDAPTADTPAAPAADPADAFWSAPVDDPDLPPSLQGKSRREVWDANKRAVQQSNLAGQQKNEAERRAEIAEAALRVITQQASSSSAAPPATPAPVEPKPHEVFGLPDRESAFAHVPDIMDKLPGLITSEATRIAQAAVAPIQQQLQIEQQKTLFAQIDLIRDSALDEAKIPVAVRRHFVPGVALFMKNNNLNPLDPESWRIGVNNQRNIAMQLVPQTVVTPTPVAPNGNRGGAGAPPPQTKKVVTTGDKKMDAELADWLRATGMDKVTSFEKVAASVRNERRNKYADDDE